MPEETPKEPAKKDMFQISTCGYDLEMRLCEIFEEAEIKFSMASQCDDELFEGTITEKSMPPKALAFYESVQLLFADIVRNKGTKNLVINKEQTLILKRKKQITEEKTVVMEFEFRTKRRELSQADKIFRLQNKMRRLQLFLKECQFDKINFTELSLRTNESDDSSSIESATLSWLLVFVKIQTVQFALLSPNIQVSDNGKHAEYHGDSVYALNIIEGTRAIKRLKISFKMENSLCNTAIGLCYIPSAVKMEYKGDFHTDPPCFDLYSNSDAWKNEAQSGSGLKYNSAGVIIHVQLYEDKLIFTKEQEPLKAVVIPLTIPSQKWKDMAMYVCFYSKKESMFILT